MSTLYVLKCHGGKYYVGVSNDADRRIAEHFGGNGCAWTQQHAVIKTELLRPVKTMHDENNMTKEYMMKYGIANVRGGAYCRVDLSPEETAALKKELSSLSGTCYKCGLTGHLSAFCVQQPRYTANRQNERELWSLFLGESQRRPRAKSGFLGEDYECFTCGWSSQLLETGITKSVIRIV